MRPDGWRPTSEPLSTKIVVVLHDRLELAEAANAAAVLALSSGVGAHSLGEDGIDAEGKRYGRIDRHPLPVLQADQQSLRELHGRASAHDDVHVVAFTEVARRARDYDVYLNDLLSSSSAATEYVGVLVRGPRNRVTSLTKRLVLFGS